MKILYDILRFMFKIQEQANVAEPTHMVEGAVSKCANGRHAS